MGTLSARRRILAVLGGGFLGTIARYLLSLLIQGWLGKSWPYDILLINLTGACMLALVTTLAETTFLIGPTRRLFINVGFLGAYTTFSSLALGDVLLFANGYWPAALLYFVISMAGGVLSVIFGEMLGKWAVQRVKHLSMERNRMEAYLQQQTGKHLPAQNAFLPPELVDEPKI